MFSAIILSPYFWDRDFIKSLDIWRKIFILCPGFPVNWDICKKTTYYVPSIWFLGKIFIQNSNHDLKKVQKSKEKLTSFLLETILILDQEIAEGFLTETDKKLILMLLQKSMLRISYRNRNLCQEVYNMTEPVLKLPTDELFEVIHERDALKRACSKKDSEIADRDARLADQNAKLADRDAKLADQDAKLAEYRRRYGDL